MYEAVASAMMMQTVVCVVAFLVIVMVVLSFFQKRKTKQYREELSDMYVAAKIRQIAAKETIDLGLEHQYFRKWEKKNKSEEGYQGFDDVVEEDLKEKLNQMKDEEKKSKQ